MNLNNLGMAYAKTKNVELAVKAYQEAVFIREESHGKEHEDVALFLLNLGVLCAKNESLKEAKRCLFRAFEIRKKAFGEADKRTQAVFSWIKYIGAADEFAEFQTRRASMMLSVGPRGEVRKTSVEDVRGASPYRVRVSPSSSLPSTGTTSALVSPTSGGAVPSAIVAAAKAEDDG
eukprot:Unigene8048_Nuclearia_a/m.24691 Unigene8048_Nuclearia_a/g.24691  ORF Unigene8048_Nuclearia_a/g.24691 Unigene8048_Nuclearia_a/m.24691 type:complete len:176 (-) Unigene8048_Nuclearia_a:107-634(-)